VDLEPPEALEALHRSGERGIGGPFGDPAVEDKAQALRQPGC
jgi:hypothetical protein